MTKEQLKQLQVYLWSAADNLRANSDLIRRAPIDHGTRTNSHFNR